MGEKEIYDRIRSLEIKFSMMVGLLAGNLLINGSTLFMKMF